MIVNSGAMQKSVASPIGKEEVGSGLNIAATPQSRPLTSISP
jgi:hypothetical protein